MLNPEINYPLIEARSGSEMLEYLRFLGNADFLSAQSTQNGQFDCSLTLPCWQRLEPLRKVGGNPGTCFVAMWFDHTMDEVYELGILPAVEQDCGLKAVRIDRKEHNNQITDEIMAGIRNAEFTVADFRGDRAGVYYEAGFARGLGRPVIYAAGKAKWGRSISTPG